MNKFSIILSNIKHAFDTYTKTNELTNIVTDEDGCWLLIDFYDMPNDVVLVACDTSDCGWSIDSAWWCSDEKCWMSTGAVTSEHTHLPYTHWQKLPNPPNN